MGVPSRPSSVGLLLTGGSSVSPSVKVSDIVFSPFILSFTPVQSHSTPWDTEEIRVGDEVTAVNDEWAIGMDSDKVSQKLADGSVGSTVRVRFVRQEHGRSLQYEVVLRRVLSPEPAMKDGPERTSHSIQVGGLQEEESEEVADTEAQASQLDIYLRSSPRPLQVASRATSSAPFQTPVARESAIRLQAPVARESAIRRSITSVEGIPNGSELSTVPLMKLHAGISPSSTQASRHFPQPIGHQNNQESTQQSSPDASPLHTHLRSNGTRDRTPESARGHEHQADAKEDNLAQVSKGSTACGLDMASPTFPGASGEGFVLGHKASQGALHQPMNGMLIHGSQDLQRRPAARPDGSSSYTVLRENPVGAHTSRLRCFAAE